MSPNAASFSPLTDELLPSAVRLSASAGWNQTAEDWARLSRLRPGGVKVWTDAGEVRASYSVVGYEHRLAWIGMILVDPEYRGRGLGKLAFAAAIEHARSGGFSAMGLDASEQGEPIYRRCGFESVGRIVRWEGELAAQAEVGDFPPHTLGLHPGVLALDREYTREDRSQLLGDFALGGCRIVSMQSEVKTIAYAVIRPGRRALHIGPVLATSTMHFAGIMRLVASVEGPKNAVCDVLDERAGSVLNPLGLRPSRHLNRMTLPKLPSCLSGEGIWCAAGFELG